MKTVAPGISVVPVRTPTLPPATHTNTYIVGQGSLSVFDPASPWEDEQERLAQALRQRLEQGERIERIVLTHHHNDHVSGAIALRDHFSSPQSPIPIAAHPVTARLVADHIRVDEHWEASVQECGGRRIQPHFTPGHAPGHLVFQDQDSGAVIAGDMIAGIGTILIHPSEGDLGHYLASLDLMREIDPTVLLPAHGEAMPAADAVLAFYIAHRHQRSDQIRTALDTRGAASPAELAPIVYAEVPPSVHPIAALQITSHLLWLEKHGLVKKAGQSRWECA